MKVDHRNITETIIVIKKMNFFRVSCLPKKNHIFLSTMSVQQLESVEQLTKLKTDITDEGFVIVFSAPWVESDAAMQAFMAEQQKLRPHVSFFYCDAEKHSNIAEAEGVDNVPHTMFFSPFPKKGAWFAKNAKIPGACVLAAQVSGAKFMALCADLDALYDPAAFAPIPSLDDHCKSLIHRNKVMLFITGTPSMPMCGFAGALMRLFHEHYPDLTYAYYDIMRDDEVCEHLKKYSDWPTYPQLYVDGELIGGGDIIKELHAKGELRNVLKL